MDLKIAIFFIIVHLFAWDRWDGAKESNIATNKQRFLNLLVLSLSAILFLQGLHLIRSGYDFWAHAGIDIEGVGGGRSKGLAFLLALVFPYFMIFGYGGLFIISLLREANCILIGMVERKNKRK